MTAKALASAELESVSVAVGGSAVQKRGCTAAFVDGRTRDSVRNTISRVIEAGDMQLRVSVLARDRKFSKAMRYVRARLQPLLDAFETVSMTDPIHEAILVGLTDERPAKFFEEVENDEGFFQVLAGVQFTGSDDELARSVFETLRKASVACPFSRPDREAFDALFDRMKRELLSPSD